MELKKAAKTNYFDDEGFQFGCFFIFVFMGIPSFYILCEYIVTTLGRESLIGSVLLVILTTCFIIPFFFKRGYIFLLLLSWSMLISIFIWVI